MTTYQQQKQQILQLFEQAIAFARSNQYPNTVEYLKNAQTHLAEGKLITVVCGEFKQGKSSLINAFLNENNLFPVDIDITTNLISTITYGKQEKITVILGEKDQETIKQIQRHEIPNYVTEQLNAKNTKKAKMLVIESPNPQLKEGLILVDTPGIGSLNTEHTAITYAFIPNADAILFITDAQTPLTTKELEFLEKRILPHTQNIIFVVTKIDILSDENKEVFLANNREKLAHILNLPENKINLIGVSSLAKLDYLEYEEEKDLKNSNFAQLEEKIWQLVTEQRGQIFLVRALSELSQSIGEMKAPIEIAWQTHQGKTQEELNQLNDRINEIQDNLQSLLSNNAEWRTILSDELQDIQVDIQSEFQEGFSHLRHQTNEYLDDSRLLNSPRQIANLLEADIDGLMARVNQNLNQRASGLYARLENVTGLNLSRFEVALGDRQKVGFSAEGISVKQSTIVDKSLSATRSAMFNSTAGTVIGGLVGGAAGATLGFVFGGVAGAIGGAKLGFDLGAGMGAIGGLAKGAKDGLDQVQEKDQILLKREITKKITLFVDDSQRICQQTLAKSIKALERAMRDEFTAQIKRQKEGWERTQRSLLESRKLSQAKAMEQSQKLQLPLQQLTQLQTTVEKLIDRILAEPIAPSSAKSVSAKTPLSAETTNTSTDYGDWADE